MGISSIEHKLDEEALYTGSEEDASVTPIAYTESNTQ